MQTSLNLDNQLSTISRSPKTGTIAVGGKNLMRLLKLTEDKGLVVYKHLKFKTNTRVGTTDLQFNPNVNFDNILASTTLSNSNILLWDLNVISIEKQIATVGSHQQLINRLSWNNYNPKLIASCSQDCFIKIWDTTDAFSSKDFKEFKSIEQKEKIRDIQFSPFSEYYFLASYGSGLIRQWDTRKETSCVTEYSLHSRDVLSVDWHPKFDNIFVSGSMDKTINIWEIGQKNPIYSYNSNDSISRVKFWVRNPQYILSSYQTNNFYVSMWNINIDNIPEYIYKGHKDAVTGFCWDLTGTKLITCSKDNSCIIHDFENGFRPIDNLCTNLTKFNQFGTLIQYSDKKPKKQAVEDVNLSKLHRKNSIMKRNFSLKCINNLYVPYSFSMDEISEFFFKYRFISKLDLIKNSKPKKMPTQLQIIRQMIVKNLAYAEMIKNQTHLIYWNQLRFLVESKVFESIFTKDKGSTVSSSNSPDPIFSQIVENNVYDIILYLTNYNNDPFLATMISYIFQEVIEFPRLHLLKLQVDCIEMLRKYKIYLHATVLIKFSIYNEIKKKNKENTLFQFTCKKCNTVLDVNSQHCCFGCKGKLTCEICLLPVNSLYTWCSVCLHGGHPNHIENWKNNVGNSCSSGCGHGCGQMY